MLIIGIDPGVSGSICFFKDGKILDVIDMPTMNEGKKNKKQVNGAQIYNEIKKKINNITLGSIVTGASKDDNEMQPINSYNELENMYNILKQNID